MNRRSPWSLSLEPPPLLSLYSLAPWPQENKVTLQSPLKRELLVTVWKAGGRSATSKDESQPWEEVSRLAWRAESTALNLKFSLCLSCFFFPFYQILRWHVFSMRAELVEVYADAFTAISPRKWFTPVPCGRITMKSSGLKSCISPCSWSASSDCREPLISTPGFPPSLFCLPLLPQLWLISWPRVSTMASDIWILLSQRKETMLSLDSTGFELSSSLEKKKSLASAFSNTQSIQGPLFPFLG